MKNKINRIFASLFLAIGSFALSVAVIGATRHYFIAAICLTVAVLLLADCAKKLDKMSVNEEDL